MIHVKVVIVGDGSIGKTCVMVRYSSADLALPNVNIAHSTHQLSLITECKI